MVNIMKAFENGNRVLKLNAGIGFPGTGRMQAPQSKSVEKILKT